MELNHFNGAHYKRWQEKVMSTLDVTSYAFAITDPKPEKEKELQNWEKANKICRHNILSTLVMHCLMFTVLIKLQLKFEKVLIRNTFLKMLELKNLLLKIF